MRLRPSSGVIVGGRVYLASHDRDLDDMPEGTEAFGSVPRGYSSMHLVVVDRSSLAEMELELADLDAG
jgi:hypothetical protein